MPLAASYDCVNVMAVSDRPDTAIARTAQQPAAFCDIDCDSWASQPMLASQAVCLRQFLAAARVGENQASPKHSAETVMPMRNKYQEFGGSLRGLRRKARTCRAVGVVQRRGDVARRVRCEALRTSLRV